jgi:prevent-host-death family protein
MFDTLRGSFDCEYVRQESATMMRGTMKPLQAPHCIEEAFMPRIGLRELKIHASEIVKDVRQNQVRYTVTNRGEPVALLIPYSQAAAVEPENLETAWRELAELLQEVGRTAQSDESTAELMKWSRRY